MSLACLVTYNYHLLEGHGRPRHCGYPRASYLVAGAYIGGPAGAHCLCSQIPPDHQGTDDVGPRARDSCFTGCCRQGRRWRYRRGRCWRLQLASFELELLLLH